MNNNKKFLLEKFIRNIINKERTGKTLYHGTIVDNIESIRNNGLMPTIGEFVKQTYLGSVDGNIDDYLEAVLYATDKKNIEKAFTAIVMQVALKLGKTGYYSVTTNDIRNHGALVILKNAEEEFDFYSREDADMGNRNVPLGVERDDYFTTDAEILPDIILTGNKLVRFFKKKGLTLDK